MKNYSLKIILLLVVAGIISTLVMDIAGGVFRAAGLASGVPPELLGKWIEQSIKGKMYVDDIRTSGGKEVVLPIFLLYHYLIGITLAVILYLLLLKFRVESIPWWLPVIFGLSTTLIPLLIMFPAMGFGMMGLKAPKEYLLLQTALLNHLFYGIGLLIAFRLLFKLRVNSDANVGIEAL